MLNARISIVFLTGPSTMKNFDSGSGFGRTAAASEQPAISFGMNPVTESVNPDKAFTVFVAV